MTSGPSEDTSSRWAQCGIGPKLASEEYHNAMRSLWKVARIQILGETTVGCAFSSGRRMGTLQSMHGHAPGPFWDRYMAAKSVRI